METTLATIEDKIRKMQSAVEEINIINQKNSEIINKTIQEIIYSLRIEAVEIEVSGFKPSFIFELPDHLRYTIKAVMEKGNISAEEVSKITERSRSLESAYLNQLVRLGYIEKNRKGQIVLYKIKFK
jgi:uncharacterized membrane protein